MLKIILHNIVYQLKNIAKKCKEHHYGCDGMDDDGLFCFPSHKRCTYVQGKNCSQNKGYYFGRCRPKAN
ncbi:hypothetical protein COX99_01150 [Candidatus Pacearchaeota archaeon CG_4_10_14_0_2_um_filter_31_10]|nr:MAG: hypothetical protein COX99_01150 [Candidatus Pacearchaeota archaeon CG_4_10_14_0_2_um_filter_31_10]